MNQLKSSSALKADAKELLLGKYKVAILAYVLMELIITGILTLIEMQVNLQTTAGLLLYYAVYFIVVFLSTVLIVGQNHLYLNMYRGQAFETNNIWIGFRICADRAILAYLMILGKSVFYAVPCIIAATLMLMTQNYYFALLVGAGAVFMIIGATFVQLDYSQVFYLILDQPKLSAPELLSASKRMMKGHRGSYFYLLVSFIGIYLLSALTFGIGMLWIYPYVTATKAGYYLELSKENT